MNKKLAIAVIHGMGSQTPDFAEAMIVELCARLDAVGRDSKLVAWKPIYWADILEERQLRYYRNAKRDADLDYTKLRKFIITAFGDAAAYQNVGVGSNNTYAQVHDHVTARIKSLYESDLDSTEVPLLIIAHSLGCHIMSNYIWDCQNPRATGNPSQTKLQTMSDFEQMKTLAGLLTFGCNIPLFTFAYESPKPIKLKKSAKWLNFYDPDDVLGYPLKPISPPYDAAVTEDIAINVGGLISMWNPMSHSEYWTDNDFTKRAASFIAEFL